MSSFSTLKQQSAFDLVLSDRASILCPSTILKYNAAFSSFLKFCSDYSFAPVPSVDLFCMYISVSCRRLNPRTVVCYLSGILDASNLLIPQSIFLPTLLLFEEFSEVVLRVFLLL